MHVTDSPVGDTNIPDETEWQAAIEKYQPASSIEWAMAIGEVLSQSDPGEIRIDRDDIAWANGIAGAVNGLGTCPDEVFLPKALEFYGGVIEGCARGWWVIVGNPGTIAEAHIRWVRGYDASHYDMGEGGWKHQVDSYWERLRLIAGELS